MDCLDVSGVAGGSIKVLSLIVRFLRDFSPYFRLTLDRDSSDLI